MRTLDQARDLPRTLSKGNMHSCFRRRLPQFKHTFETAVKALLARLPGGGVVKGEVHVRE